MKARLKNDGSALENEADGQANSILESQTPDATNIEEGQVNGLLEILDSRPDVQDIIRRGMAMDFADDNAKILYVGHLIDQALTRPDVLALYYASSHGRTNNVRIKNELSQNKKSDTSSNNTDNDDEETQSESPPINKRKTRTTRKRHKHKKKNRNNNHKEKQLDFNELPPITPNITVKTEPTSTSIPHQNQNHTMPPNVVNVQNMHNLHGPMQQLHPIQPVPATISLSGGAPMNFANFPPPIGGIPHHLSIPSNLPPIHLPFPIPLDPNNTNQTNKNNGNMPQFPLNVMINNTDKHNESDSNEQNTQNTQDENEENEQNENNHNDHNNDNDTFPMNVTPSVSMMGGPPLASM